MRPHVRLHRRARPREHERSGRWARGKTGEGESTYIVALEVVHVALGQHTVVFQFRLPERGSVASLYACKYANLQSTCEGRRTIMTSFAFPDRRDLRVLLYPSVTEPEFVSEVSQCRRTKLRAKVCWHSPLPDFITSARRELMVSAVFLLFLGAIAALR